MDVDRFIETNQATWAELRGLQFRSKGKLANLSQADLDALIQLNRRVSIQLSYARTNFRDPKLIRSLSDLVARSNHLIHSARPRSFGTAVRWLAFSFPAVVWRLRRHIAVAAALTFVPAIVLAVSIANSPDVRARTAPQVIQDTYVESTFADYYTEQPAAVFGAQVYTNNVRVAFLAFAAGITFGVGTAFILITNGAIVGYALGLFGAYGKLGFALGLLAPHGLIELTSIVIAGAAGLCIGWSLIDPGQRRRRDALVSEAREMMSVMFGLVLTLGVAGLIEGFITGHVEQAWLRVGIGVAVFVGFIAWIVLLGRPAYRRGYTGQPDEALAARFA